MQKKFIEKIKKILKKSRILVSNGKNIRRLMKPLWVYMASKTTSPLSNYYGLDRGIPLDRFYIEDFLKKNKFRIQGKCLEVLENIYTERFGGTKVTSSDILDINPDNKKSTIIADIRNMPNVTSNSYDCIILTQVLQFIDDPSAAIKEVYRILKPGGYILATLPSISRVDCLAGTEGDFWRFTEASAHIIFKNFSVKEITSRGNCRSGMFFLAGASQQEVSKKVLDLNDRQFPVIITVVAQKT